MARQPMNVKPYVKHMESYNNFSGGLNTVTSIENLKDNEFPDLTNIDLGDRGSLKRRYGMKKVLHHEEAQGMTQGYFRYYHSNGEYDEIQAIGGRLYRWGAELQIEGLPTFQDERMIEAVQFREKLWIATGTKLVEYDGQFAKVVEPYKPEPLEALYIGTNGLAENPDEYLQDGTAIFLRIEGIRPSMRYGVVNKSIKFFVYISQPSGTVEYKMDFRPSGSTDTWTTAKDWGTSKEIDYTFKTAGTYEIRFLVRMQGATEEVDSYLPEYRVTATNENEVIETDSMHDCTRILLHWDRLLLYGDPTQPDIIYVSHLNQPEYFPMGNSLQFEAEKGEGLTALVKYRDMVVAFTPSSIQGLYGKGPYGDDPYRRVLISNSIGCVAPYSAKVMGNYVTFLSREGVHILKSLSFSEDRMNVEKIDNKIDNLIPRDEYAQYACAVVQDLQYHITFPTLNRRFRYYYEMDTWTKDESEHLNLSQMYNFDGECYGLDIFGVLYRFDPTVWDDDGYVYEDYIKFKDFDFSMPYNPKKLKELQMVFAHQTVPVNLTLSVYADAAIVLDPNKSHAVVDNGYVTWKEVIEPNLELLPGTVLGEWKMGKDPFGLANAQVHKFKISGKCRRTRVEIRHKESTPNQLYGLGYIFKIKNP